MVNDEDTPCQVTVDDEKWKVEDNFKYLGSVVQKGDMAEEISDKTMQGRRVVLLNTVIRENNFSMEVTVEKDNSVVHQH